MPDRVNANRLVRGRNLVLELAILAAMALAALAFAAGLYVNGGIGIVSTVIAGIALFLVMAASQASLSRAHRFSAIVDRIEELQGAILRFNEDVERVDAFAARASQWDDVLERMADLDDTVDVGTRLDRLSQRVMALERSVETIGRSDPLSDHVALLDRITEQVQRIDPLSERVAALDRIAATFRRLDPLADRVDALESAVRPIKRLDIAALGEGDARIERVGAHMERLDARLEALRSQVQIEGKERQEKLTSELQLLETLVKQLAEQFASRESGRVGHRPPAHQSVSASAFAPAPAPAHQPVSESAFASAPAPAPAPAPSPAIADAGGAEPVDPPDVPDETAVFEEDYLDDLILDRIRRSIEANKIDLYLQPIVGLPQRRPHYYEALTRLRNEADELILPKDYIHVAESAGIMPLVDNMMLFRSVQVLRRLSERSSARGLFCNISIHSLLDAEFFTEFIAFMDQNRALADSLYFEFSQAMVASCGPIEHESLNALASLGFRFSLDQVSKLDVDFQSLHEMGFRFVKIPVGMFLHGMAEAGARIHQADMRSYLDRYGLQLVVEKIEDERSLTSVIENDVGLAQGYLFSEPRPVRPEVFAGKDAVAAA